MFRFPVHTRIVPDSMALPRNGSASAGRRELSSPNRVCAPCLNGLREPERHPGSLQAYSEPIGRFEAR